ncbi:hypothetical protein AOL_s00043g609 [Orbilia oligospora ATCC 24927]|uniref:Peptidase M48 domain-containing protein n=2 Tax=Orbilia oligospora TaxID=2813651 RepID=G1X4I5_ARTOA|nr:hypothetical protein AOL_s00043g609 [Orbilia oligospora ATCC 24927]EGX51875.1 hypothetical protein AOL_s00043g609 [Orbilia oligospora ATCC 24927]KAF3273037.1 hypothetical protein TWF970_009429 [Orbilia oligospora]
MLPSLRIASRLIRTRFPTPRTPLLPRLSQSPTTTPITTRRLFYPSNISRQFHTTPPNPSPTKYQQTQRLRWGAYIALLRWAARPTFILEAAGLGALTGGFYVYNLEEVPISGRRRFNIISEDFLQSLSEDKNQEILSKYQGQILPESDPRFKQVRRVLEKLAPNSGLPSDYNWEATVIESDEANAFVIPGGKVFVFTGILPVCGGDDGLAAVLGHEIGHNVARHLGEQISRGIFLIAAAWVVELFWGVPGDMSLHLLQFAIDMPKSRAQESEADHIGLLLMAKSCYDPKAAVAVWKRMEIEEQKTPRPPEMLSTHPSSRRRQTELTALLPKAYEIGLDSDCAVTGQYTEQFKKFGQELDFSF